MRFNNALVVCYSRTGTTASVAEGVAHALGCPVERLVDETSRAGAIGAVRGRIAAWLGRTTHLAPIHHDPSRHDLIVVATPVWGRSVPPAVRTYLRSHARSFVRLAFVCTENTTGAGRVFRQMTDLTGHAPLAVVALRRSEIGSSRPMPALDAFIDEIARARLAA